MKRREFLTTAAAGATIGAASAFPAPAIAQERIELTMVAPWPKGAPGVGVNAERLAASLTTMSDGRLNVNYFAGGELVPPFEAFDAVAAGTADMLHGTPYYWSGKSQAFQWFTGVPFGMTALEHQAWFYYGEGQALWDEAYEPFGLKPFYAGSSGVQAGGWFTKPITSVEDLQGLKMRIAGLGGEAMRRLGVSVILLPPGEIFGALQSGTIDAAEWVGPWNDLAFGLHRIAKIYMLPAFHEPGPALEFTMNRSRYEGLPSDLKAIVDHAARASTATATVDFLFHNVMSIDPLVTEHGVEMHKWPDEVITALGAATREVVDEVAASDPLAGRVRASHDAFLAKARVFASWFDAEMLRMRDLADV